MDGWMDGDGRTDRQMDGQMDEQTAKMVHPHGIKFHNMNCTLTNAWQYTAITDYIKKGYTLIWEDACILNEFTSVGLAIFQTGSCRNFLWKAATKR